MKFVNNFKNIIFILFIVSLMLLSSFSVIAVDPELASFEIVLLSYEPNPAEPGSYVDFDIKATNIGKQEAKDAKFELITEYPFSLDSNEVALKEFGAVGSKQEIILNYKVRVDTQAVLGNTPLKLRYTTDGSNWLTKEMTINVKTSEAILVIDSIESPETLIPGEISTIDITVKNLASATLKDVTLKLDLASQTATTVSEFITFDQPFVPIGSGMEMIEKFLPSGSSKTFSYRLMTYADAESKIYKIPLVISYKDESGTEYTKSEILGVLVGSTPKLTIEVDASKLHAMNGYGDVSFKIINKGFTDVKFLTASLVDSDQYQIDSHSKELYVGSVDSDDYESVTFNLKALSKEVLFKLKLDYTDANNRPFSEVMEIPVNVVSESDNKQSIPWSIIVLIVSGIVIFIWWKKHKKKKRD